MSSQTFDILKYEPYLVAIPVGRFSQEETHMYTGIESISLTK